MTVTARCPRFRAKAALAALAMAALALGVAPGPALAQAVSDTTPLGRSASSGVVCQAVRDYADPLAQAPATRAWSVRCLGWDAPIGRLYRFTRQPQVQAWRKDVTARAACQGDKADAIQGLAAVRRSPCRIGAQALPYVAFVGRKGRFWMAGEGFAQTSDVIETGLRVASGSLKPPEAAQAQSSQALAAIASDFGGQLSGLASAEQAAANDASLLAQRGYVQSNEWRFDTAATDFRALSAAAQAQNAPLGDRAMAALNLALNISNNGQFAEADTLFGAADALVARAGDPALRAEALTYRAYHLRNQRRFADAARTAQQALTARGQARRSAIAAAQAAQTNDPRVIDAALSDALNVRAGGQTVLGQANGPDARLALQDVETLEILGSSQLAMNQAAAAQASLADAEARLHAVPAEGADIAALAARIEADKGDLALSLGRADQAAEDYTAALKTLRTRHAGSPPEGGLLLRLGRADLAAGRDEPALAAYAQAFAVLKASRGSLGASADEAGPYLDRLIALQAKDPAHARDYTARFFAAAEAVVSDATAQTISRLAARVAAGDDATAGLVRAVDDTRRQIAAAESRIATLQSAGAYVGEAKANADAELKQLQVQLAAVNGALLDANPRYDQLIAADATLQDVQKALRPDEVYVKVLFLGGRGFGILISRDAAVPYAIAMGRSAAAAAAEHLRAPMEGADEGLDRFDVSAAYALYRSLLGPVSERLLKARHLIWEPDAKLVSLPVAVLVTDPASVALMKSRAADPKLAEDYRGVAWLGARLDSSLVLSADTFLQARAFKPSTAAHPFLAFANPQFARSDARAYQALLREGAEVLERTSSAARAARICQASRKALLGLEDLPDTGKEAQIVAASLGAGPADVVSGQAFDDAAVRGRADLGQYRIVYFATHALLPMPDACVPEPALVTSLGAQGSDGLLTGGEIVNLRLDADLVVLSACDTGGAGSSDAEDTGLSGGGEALGGLTRAFIYAGARGLIVSHWSVDSAATEALMTQLFRSGAPSLAEGLREAQIRMQAEAKTSHPYYWAPFTLVGDGARPIPAGSVQRQASL